MLHGRRIAVPESRELDLFVNMLERHGAIAVRCPLVSIHDVEDTAPVHAWLERLVEGQHDSLVLYTGEGLSRLLGCARRSGIEADVIDSLRRTHKIVRGPKPAKVLRGIGLAPEQEDEQVAGLIDALVTGAIHLIAFTSTAQVRRLQDVARRFGRRAELDAAMRRALIAAVGPVTAQAVEGAGWPVAAMPKDSFHLKPMVVALGRKLAAETKANCGSV
jgi:uroporphyrinogen-III synthase